tara:strand:- start:4042 stop:4647 length:606 start_codon:yes stop_codon:yes gene_type:complete
MSYTQDQIEKVMSDKGYIFFQNGKYNVNIIGIRDENVTVNEFCDEMHIMYQDGENKWQHHVYKITTVAGLTGLVNPVNSKGCAILVEGQYRGAYKIRKHRGKYDALCQQRKLKVYRDNDKDQEHDFDAETIEEGYFGINIHRSNSRRESTVVNNWSLGCQVFANPDQFSEFMNICYKAMNVWGNNFTYTLINESDFSDHSN